MFSKLFNRKTTVELFEEGVALYQSGNAEAAVDKLSDAIEQEEKKSVQDKQLLSNMHCIRGEVYPRFGVGPFSD